MKREKEIKL